MMQDEFWLRFTQTGRAEDYIEYKKHEDELKAVSDENNYKRLGNTGADNRGE